MEKIYLVEQFSEFLNLQMKNRIKRICFLIGSEIGLDDSFKKEKCFFIWKTNLASFNDKNNVN